MAAFPTIACPICNGAELVKIEITEPCACSRKPVKFAPVSDEEAAHRYREMLATLTRAQQRGTDATERAREAEARVGEAAEQLTQLAFHMKANTIARHQVETEIARAVLVLEKGEIAP